MQRLQHGLKHSGIPLVVCPHPRQAIVVFFFPVHIAATTLPYSTSCGSACSESFFDRRSTSAPICSRKSTSCLISQMQFQTSRVRVPLSSSCWCSLQFLASQTVSFVSQGPFFYRFAFISILTFFFVNILFRIFVTVPILPVIFLRVQITAII